MSVLFEIIYLYFSITASMQMENTYAPPINRMLYAYHIRDASIRYKLEDPLIAIAIIGHESKWESKAIRPGCNKKIKKRCNRNGRSDVGLFQIHMNHKWTPLSFSDALNYRLNINEGIRQLMEKREHHRLRSCERRKEWHEKWPHSRYKEHSWIQHNNMGSKGYDKVIEAKVSSLRRRLGIS